MYMLVYILYIYIYYMYIYVCQTAKPSLKTECVETEIKTSNRFC